jgi:hypothetical protein
MEENFQSVMRRLAHIVHGEINKMVPDFAGSILREPRDAIHSRFFPDGVWEEHREYLVTQLERPEQMTKNHAFNGSYRGTDEMVYFGDRRPQHGTWGGGGGEQKGRVAALSCIMRSDWRCLFSCLDELTRSIGLNGY